MHTFLSTHSRSSQHTNASPAGLQPYPNPVESLRNPRLAKCSLPSGILSTARREVLRIVHAVWLLSVALVAASCSNVLLISEYDEATDRAVTELHRKVEMFLLYLDDVVGTPEGEFGEHEYFYREVEVDISAIAIRAAARSKNDLQVEQVSLLESSWRDFRALHRLGLTREQIPPARTALNVIFTAMLKLEFEKRRTP